MVDEYSWQCLAIDVDRKQTSREVLRTLAKLMLRYGVPKHIQSNNGPEWARVCGQGGVIMVGKTGCANAVYLAGRPLGERLHRKLQW